MPPSGSFANGKFTRRPGVTAKPDFSANEGEQITPKRLCVVGYFPFLKQAEPKLYFGQRSMLEEAPLSRYLKRVVTCVYNAGKDKRIGKPSEVVLVNAGTGTQASLTLVDAASANAITLKPKAYGYASNRTAVTLSVSSGKYTFVFSRVGEKTETIGPISGVDLFSIVYAGNDSFTTAAGFNSSGEFFVTASKASIATGPFTPGCWWGGTITIDPDTGPSGGTYTALVTGINETTGTVGDTETLTWTDGGGHAAQTTTKKFSKITSILFENNSGGGTPTFTVSGDMVRASAEEYPTVKQLTDFLSTLTDDLTISSITPIAASIMTEDIDVTASTSLGSAVTFKCIKARLIDALEESTMMDVTDVAAGGVPVAASGYCVGGTESEPGSGDWATALAALTRTWKINVIGLLTDDATAHLAAASHTITMWGTGRYECQVWTGTAALASKATITARAATLNDFCTSIVPQEALINIVDGKQERIAPCFYALMHAAAQCGLPVSTGLTWKSLNVVEVYDGTDWGTILDDDIEELLAANLTITTNSDKGLRVERSLTSYVESSDDARTQPSAVEGIAAYNLRIRNVLEAVIGDPAQKSTKGRLESIVDAESVAMLNDGYAISDYDPTRLSVTQAGGRWVVESGIAPIYSIEQIDLVPHILPNKFQI